MAHYLAADRDHPAIDDRKSPYRFGSVRAKHGRAALSRVNGYLKSLIEKIADAKVHRMQRELALRGIYFDASEQSWVTRASGQPDRR